MRFNLNDYETVEERIKRFYTAHEDGRIVTEWQNFDDYIDGQKPGSYVMKAFVYLTAGDQANGLPKATGYALEVAQGPQAQWSMELSETSAIGRALANMNLSGNKRSSREEMEKVERVSQAALDYLAELDNADTVEGIRELYAKAVRGKAAKEVLDKIKAKGESLK